MKKMIVAFIALCTLSVAAFADVNIKACAGCHGANFEKSAMNKSKIVADMTKQEVSDALVGYKNGTYGGAMKNLMKMQVSKYSEEELQNTGLGKSETKNTTIKEKKVVKEVKKTNVVLSHKNIVAYKDGSTCWVVDFETHKSNLLDCKRLKAAAKKKSQSMVPPTKGDMPNPFVGLLK
jgi:cytochrome c-type protein NapB